jgi:hypothetical protein
MKINVHIVGLIIKRVIQTALAVVLPLNMMKTKSVIARIVGYNLDADGRRLDLKQCNVVKSNKETRWDLILSSTIVDLFKNHLKFSVIIYKTTNQGHSW